MRQVREVMTARPGLAIAHNRAAGPHIAADDVLATAVPDHDSTGQAVIERLRDA